MSPKSETTMSGTAARAVARATSEFVASGQAVDRFEVVVMRHAESYEVVFVPEPDPGASVRGGQTSAGREMHFWISAADGELLKTSFAR
jgi:hypothetical protein